jgi:KDO2-lipid IV(A) lauroyltransferase
MIHRGIPLTTIGREARNPAGQHILAKMRQGYGIETIWRSDRRAVKRLMECMKERRVVAALIDQDTRVDSLYVPFFGSPAKTPSSLISLGKRARARFVSAFLFRVGFMRYEVFTEEFPDDLSEDELLAMYNARLEALIRRFPGQWVWFHKRWRSRPDGTVLSTRQYLACMSPNAFDSNNVTTVKSS